MLYRKMESTGDELSVLGYGCMRLPEKGGRIDEERARNQLLSAIDRGVNYVDTSMTYHRGASEPFLGRSLRGGYREKVKLATKMPHWNVRARKDMDRFLSTQMRNLQTDHIDYYLIHNLQYVAWNRLKDLDVTGFIEEAVDDGRIRNIGFSYHGGKDHFRAIVDDYPWRFCQLQINYLDRDNQAGLEGMRYAASKGLGVIAMEPLRGGILARKPPAEIQAIWDSGAVSRSPAEWALRWVWNLPEVSIALSGMNEEAHIEENLRVADDALPDSLTAQEIGIVDLATLAIRQSLKVGCTGCRYCMPCASGVQIPAIFEAYNEAFIGSTHPVITPHIRYIMDAGGLLTGDPPGFASQCVECGACLDACPQRLPIPALLKDAAKKFEGPGMSLTALALKGYFRLEGWRAKKSNA